MSLGDGKSREEIFMDWISERIRYYKTLGLTRQDVADRGGVSRNQLYEWEGRGKKGFSMPKPDTLRRFCDGNGEDWHVPFRILGWIGPGSTMPDLESPAERQMRLIRVRLEQNPPAKERQELEIALVQLQASERMQRDAVSAAEEALRRAAEESARELSEAFPRFLGRLSSDDHPIGLCDSRH